MGTDIEVPDPPTAYTLLLYRRKMKISWQEAMDTPWYIVQQDIEMMNFEDEYRPRPPKSPQVLE
jgi:hypothetical protein